MAKRAGAATAALLAADGAVLATLRDAPGVLAERLAGMRAWPSHPGVDAVASLVAAAALWVVAAWLGIGLVAALGARLPGALGRLARRVAAIALPRALYRVAAGAAGLGVLLSPAVASARTSPPPPAVPVLTAPALPAAPALPTAPTVPTVPAVPAVPTVTIPAPRLPVAAAPRHAARPGTAELAERAPTTAETPETPETVTVRPGDSLWRIAAAQSPAPATPRRIAAAWPRWFAANRDVIGPDPNLLLPGQILHAPASPPTVPVSRSNP